MPVVWRLDLTKNLSLSAAAEFHTSLLEDRMGWVRVSSRRIEILGRLRLKVEGAVTAVTALSFFAIPDGARRYPWPGNVRELENRILQQLPRAVAESLRQPGGEHEEPVVLSDAGGGFALPVPATGASSVRFESDGFVPFESPLDELRGPHLGAAAEPVEVVLEPGRTAAGRVLGPRDEVR